MTLIGNKSKLKDKEHNNHQTFLVIFEETNQKIFNFYSVRIIDKIDKYFD